MYKNLEDKLKFRLIEFARKYDLIRAITKGINPEKGLGVYYFIVNPTYNKNLEDEISNLKLKLSNEKYEYNLVDLPCSSKISDYILENSFLGDILWERD